MRAQVPIYAADDVIEESAIEMEGDDVNEEEIVDEFKRFLEGVTPEDFAEAESAELELEPEAEPDDDDDASRRAASRRRRACRSASSVNIVGAIHIGTRTQPCEAGYGGTDGLP